MLTNFILNRLASFLVLSQFFLRTATPAQSHSEGKSNSRNGEKLSKPDAPCSNTKIILLLLGISEKKKKKKKPASQLISFNGNKD